MNILRPALILPALFLLMSCAPEKSALLIQDNPLKEVFLIQELTENRLKRELARAGYALDIVTAPLRAEDNSWTVNNLISDHGIAPDTMDLIIISPLLDYHIDDLITLMNETGRLLYLGQLSPRQQRERVRGISLMPDLGDRAFLSYINNQNFTKAMIYDPALFNGFDDLRDRLPDLLPDDLLVPRDSLSSREILIQDFDRLGESGADHVILMLPPSAISLLADTIRTRPPESLPTLISTVLPVRGPVIGGFPYQYRHIIPQALQSGTTPSTAPADDAPDDAADDAAINSTDNDNINNNDNSNSNINNNDNSDDDPDSTDNITILLPFLLSRPN